MMLSEEDNAKIEKVLLGGSWRALSVSVQMARTFREELTKAGYGTT